MRPLLIHPGLHKTATSWLQAVPFADRTEFNSLMSHAEIDALIARPHDWQWQPDAARQHIRDARSRSGPAKIDVISSEILTGNPFFGSREVPMLVSRVREAVPDARILLTVREQGEWLRSLYQQYVKRGGNLSLDDFLSGEAEPQYPSFDYITLEFDRFAQAYADAFGKENVLVLPQELLRENSAAFFASLSEFMGVETIVPKPEWRRAVGSSPPRGSDWLLRVANGFQDKPLRRASGNRLAWLGQQLERVAYRLPKHGRAPEFDLPRSRIAASNARLQDFSPVDLQRYGYCIFPS